MDCPKHHQIGITRHNRRDACDNLPIPRREVSDAIHSLVYALVAANRLARSRADRAPCDSRGEHRYSLRGVHNTNNRWLPYDYDVARSRIYLEGSYGFTGVLEGFSRVGASDQVIGDIDSFRPGMARDVSSDGYPAFLSGGLRGKAWQFGNASIGASLEAAWYFGQERTIRWKHDVYQELLFDPTVEINAGVTVGYDLGRSVVYAGPLVHFGYIRADVRTHEFGPDWDIEEHVDALTIRDKGGCGGLLGWRAPLGENGWHLQIEGAGLAGGFAGSVGLFRAW